jgi:hypothetical protein
VPNQNVQEYLGMENTTKLNAVPLRCAIKTNYKQMGIGRADETLDEDDNEVRSE